MRASGIGVAYRIATGVAALAVVALLSPPAVGQVQVARLDSKLRTLVSEGTRGPQRVILRAQKGREAAIREAVRAAGGSVVAEHAGSTLTAVVDARVLDRLAGRDGVISVSADAVVRPQGQLLGTTLNLLSSVTDTLVNTVEGLVDTVGTIIDPATNTAGPAVPPWVLRATLGVDGTPWTGRGVGVAVIDSGIEMSADFEGRITAFYDFTGGQTTAKRPFDDYGHGTHVAGIIGASGALSSNRHYRGLAPGVRFIGLKVLDATGAGHTSDVIRAIDFAVTNRQRFGIHIINLSLGHPIYEPAATDPLVQAVERASRAGIIVVAAAGNLGVHPDTGLPGYAGVTSPGNAPSAITIGAVQTLDTVARRDDRMAPYSSAGPTWYDALVKPDLVAPGHNIVATAARNGSLYRTYPHLKAADADYMRLSGTSMGAGVASGILALVVEAHRAGSPDAPLSPNLAKAALQYTAIAVRNDLGIDEDPLRQGAGALNGAGAIDLARRIDTTAPAGAYWLTSTPSPWSVIGGQTHPWSQSVTWGSGIIWGSTVTQHHTAWGTGIIWGSDVTWGSGIIWGSNLVWTDSNTWASGIIWGSHAIGYSGGSGIIWGSTTGLTPESTAWKPIEP